MESNNLSFEEQSTTTSQLSETKSENSMNQELNDSELDAIAGGLSMKAFELLKAKYPSSSLPTFRKSRPIPVINLK